MKDFENFKRALENLSQGKCGIFGDFKAVKEELPYTPTSYYVQAVSTGKNLCALRLTTLVTTSEEVALYLQSLGLEIIEKTDYGWGKIYQIRRPFLEP